MHHATYQKKPTSALPLTAMQQGMLFNALFAPDAGVDLEQVVADLPEDVDARALEQAWRLVARRIPVLRHRFHWEGIAEPVQSPDDDATVSVAEVDLRGQPPSRREASFSAFCREDRRAGFAFDLAPLMRLTLFRLADRWFRLLWTFPHALLDGRSFPIVLDQVFHAYGSLRDGREPALGHPPQFRDYLSWLARQDRTASAGFWRERLAGFASATPLIADPDAGATPPGDEAASIEHGCEQALVPEDTADRISELASRYGVSPHTFLQGAWSLLLSRSSGERDVVFGSTRACRHAPVEGLAGMVGIFINTVPLRIAVEESQPLSAFLAGIKAQQVALREHELSALVQVQEWSGIPRGRRLFESILVYDDETLEATLRRLGPAWTERRFRIIEKTNLPLTVLAWRSPRFVVRIQYDRSRFTAPTIERMLGHLQAILAGMSRGLDQRVGDIDHLTAPERQRALMDWNAEWNATVVSPSLEPCLHHLVERQAASAPDRLAVVCGERRLTYGDLLSTSARVAAKLRTLDIAIEDPVAIMLDRGVDLPVAMLGVLRAGGAYVPLDPSYPRDRVRYILEHTRARALVTTTDCAHRHGLDDAGTPLVLLDPGWEAGHDPGTDREAASVPVSAGHLAYIIFTSGSTGRPKGVMIEHGGAVNTILDIGRRFAVGADDRILGLSSATFDLSVFDVFGALAAGAALVLPEPDAARDPARWARLVEREGVTVWNSVPALVEMAVEHAERQAAEMAATAPIGPSGGDARQETRGPLASLRLVMMSGDWIPLALPRRLAAHAPRADQYSLGGATEASIWSIAHRIGAPRSGWSSVPYGRPLANQTMYVLDRRLEPCAALVRGELYIGGAGLARGYWGDDEKTAAAFFVHPTTRRRLYRTGDLGRWHPDGTIEFLGRIDHQVKIRGYRIEMGEIETVLSTHAGARECVVAAREDLPGQKTLVAYVVPQAGMAIDAEDLRRHLRQQLPDYMVPSSFVQIARLPLGANGKIDRQALPAPLAMRGEATAPSTDLEERMVAIWRELLGIDRVGVDDDFFELGGNSLMALRLIDRIERQCGQSVGLAEVFEHPTIGRLAARLQRRMDRQRASILIPLQPNGARTPMFFISGFLDIGRHVGHDQPFYGLDCPAESKLGQSDMTFSRLASRCIDEMRSIQPRGPYLLGGHCFGAVLAFEIANQLQAGHDEVGLLALMDPPVPAAIAAQPRSLDRLWFHAVKLMRRNPLDQARYVVERFRNLQARLSERMRGESLAELYADFSPRVFSGRLAMFLAKDTYLRFRPDEDPRLRWERWATAGLEVIESPGDHVTFCREPHVRVLGAQLRECLDRALEPAASQPGVEARFRPATVIADGRHPANPAAFARPDGVAGLPPATP